MNLNLNKLIEGERTNSAAELMRKKKEGRVEKQCLLMFARVD